MAILHPESERRIDATCGDDRRLVSEFVRFGDESAFRSLYHRHTPPVFRVISRLVGAERSAEDALQMMWIRAAENLHRFRWESSLRSWLTGIAINCCREILRREKRDRADSIDETSHSLPRRPAPRAGLRIDLERAIGSLSPGYREVLVLHDVEGYTHMEIGELLGIEPGTSKSQLSRARRALRAKLGAEGSSASLRSERVEK